MAIVHVFSMFMLISY